MIKQRPTHSIPQGRGLLRRLVFLLIFFRYRGYHEDFWPYNFSKQYWELIAVRLAFVFVFQFTVLLVSNSITYLVPDVPESFALKKKREKELIKIEFGNKVLKARSTQRASVFSIEVVQPLAKEPVGNQPVGPHLASEDAVERVSNPFPFVVRDITTLSSWIFLGKWLTRQST